MVNTTKDCNIKELEYVLNTLSTISFQEDIPNNSLPLTSKLNAIVTNYSGGASVHESGLALCSREGACQSRHSRDSRNRIPLSRISRVRVTTCSHLTSSSAFTVSTQLVTVKGVLPTLNGLSGHWRRECLNYAGMDHGCSRL